MLVLKFESSWLIEQVSRWSVIELAYACFHLHSVRSTCTRRMVAWCADVRGAVSYVSSRAYLAEVDNDLSRPWLGRCAAEVGAGSLFAGGAGQTCGGCHIIWKGICCRAQATHQFPFVAYCRAGIRN
jgi:hypothetical protein